MKRMLANIKRIIWAIRFKSKVKEANKLAALFNMRYFVIMMNGSLKVVPKKALKELIAKKRFKSGTTIQDIEKHALYITR